MAKASARKLSQVWVTVNANTVARFRLFKGNYDSSLATICGLNFSRIPDGKTVIKGSVRNLVKQGVLANYRISVEKTSETSSNHIIYCARDQADNVLGENGAASATFGGKKIISVNGITS